MVYAIAGALSPSATSAAASVILIILLGMPHLLWVLTGQALPPPPQGCVKGCGGGVWRIARRSGGSGALPSVRGSEILHQPVRDQGLHHRAFGLAGAASLRILHLLGGAGGEEHPRAGGVVLGQGIDQQRVAAVITGRVEIEVRIIDQLPDGPIGHVALFELGWEAGLGGGERVAAADGPVGQF